MSAIHERHKDRGMWVLMMTALCTDALFKRRRTWKEYANADGDFMRR
ncbi:hypothetical protein [Pseudoalteromonas sp. T1lg23B]|nr:hypothetical protein [Pseudoalteromonas sp. T1lg23B]